MVQTEPTKSLLAALEDADPLRALRAAAALQADANQRTEILVRRARNAGCTWAEIAAALGVSRQAVHKRYGR
jgi:DNA-directed RNA polymerase specialized sigma24 family protein